MEKVQRSQSYLRKRKMLVVSPLLVIPFLTMAFWAIGGGKEAAPSEKVEKVQGLNINLPNAHLKEDKLEDKLSFYDRADKDSIKLAELMRSDPYYRKKDEEPLVSDPLHNITQQTASKYKQNLNTSIYGQEKHDAAAEILERVNKLQTELNKPSAISNDTEKLNRAYASPNENPFSNEVDRLEKMMQGMSKPDSQDHEFGKLEGVLDKILDIQHPERINDQHKEKLLPERGLVFPVTKEYRTKAISLLDISKENAVSEAGFFGIEKEAESVPENSIRAVFHETQSLINGSVVRLRLADDIYIDGSPIPAGTFLNGIASLNGERLEVQINSLRSNNSLYRIKLNVYDLDGLPGIYIPGAISREVVKQSADNTLQSMELSSMDPSLKAQAATAGANVAKSMLSKKVKLVRVTVKDGYKVLLKDSKADQ